MSQEEYDPEYLPAMSDYEVFRILDGILGSPPHSSNPDRPQVFDGVTRLQVYTLLKDMPAFKKTGTTQLEFTESYAGNFRGFSDIALKNPSLTQKDKITLAFEIIEALKRTDLWPPALDEYDRIGLMKWEAGQKAFARRSHMLTVRTRGRARQGGKRRVRKTHRRSRR
jgi:hypothetical protein